MSSEICTPYHILCADSIWVIILAVILFAGIAIACYIDMHSH
jgi:hypothetical protein